MAVPTMPSPDPSAKHYFDIDDNRVVDRFDLSDLVRHLAAAEKGEAPAEPLPPGPMGPYLPDTYTAEGESGPTTPTVWLTTNATYLIEGAPAVPTFSFSRSPAEGSLTVNFALSGTASESDWQSPLLSIGQITFPSGESTVQVEVAALDDEILENAETLIVTLVGSPLYYIGSGPATTELHDGEHGIIEADFTVMYLGDEGDDDWRPEPDGMIWEGMTHRWWPEIPAGLEGEVQTVEFFRREQGNPLADWESFAGSEFSPSATEYYVDGHPGAGHWDIMFRVEYGLLSWLQTAPVAKTAPRIDHVEWIGLTVAGETNLVEETLDSVRFYPEKNRYDADDTDTHTEVLLRVYVTPNLPNIKVYVKAFDPDDPSASTNPIDNDGEGGAVKDNRGAATDLEGGKWIATEGVAGTQGIAETRFTPTKAIGDNFRVVAAPTTAGFTSIKALFSPTTPETRGRLIWTSNSSSVPNVILDAGSFTIAKQAVEVSRLLTVWRTLWAEVDSMPDPTGIWFDDDDLLTFMPPPDISGFGPALAEMFIDAKILPAEFNVKKPVTDNDPETPGFLREFGTQAQLKAYFLDDPNGVRDTKDESDHYWTVYVASVYEFGPANAAAPGNDNDLDPEFGLMGWTYQDGQNIEVSLVAMEVVRDLATQNEPHWATMPDAGGRLIPIVTLHEVGHQFLGDGHHDGDFPSFVMAGPSTDVSERRIPEMLLRFSPEHIAEIREEYKTGKHP